MQFSKKSLIIILAFLVICSVVLGAFMYFSSRENIAIPENPEEGNLPIGGEVERQFGTPVEDPGELDGGSYTVGPNGEVLKKYAWSYNERKYAVAQELYSSIYNTYSEKPEQYVYFSEIPAESEDEYYGIFLAKEQVGSSAIDELSGKIVSIGRELGLTDDQIVDFIMAFVQEIPYDDQKSINIANKKGNEKIRYPYETLFDNRGVSFDKSLLAASLIKSFGYGTSVIVYDNGNHMAVGVQCTAKYSTFKSGYCYFETTNYMKIGEIPDLNGYGGKAIVNMDGEKINSRLTLGWGDVFQKSTGKEYDIQGALAAAASAGSIGKKEPVLSAQEKAIQAKMISKKTEVDKLKKKYLSKSDDIYCVPDALDRGDLSGDPAELIALMQQTNVDGDGVVTLDDGPIVEWLQANMPAPNNEDVQNYIDEINGCMGDHQDINDAMLKYYEAEREYSDLVDQFYAL